MQKSCFTCKHGEKREYEEPCRTCMEKGPEWEKWEPEEPRRPEMLEKPVPVYESDTSEYPDIIRVSFRDGHTEIYERRLQQPAPIIMKCIETIREWNIGYQYQPKRRRRAKR